MDFTEPGVLKRRLVDVFDRTADVYDTAGVPFFGPIGRRLVELAGIAPGERVLDVGTGRGACLFPCAAATGPSGTVTGIDLSPEMARRTGHEARHRGLANVRVAVMDAERPELPARSFDAVLGSCSIVLLPHAEDALPRYHELLRPGGRLAFSGPDIVVGEPFAFAPGAAMERFAEIFRAQGMDLEETLRRMFLFGPDRLVRSVQRAGFTSVTLHVETLPVAFESGEQWVRWSWTHGMRVAWEMIPEKERADVERELAADVETWPRRDGRIVMPAPINYVVARRA